MILKNGSRGKEVKELQEFLGIHADGIFGNGTERAVKAWQQENGLVADGIVGRKTFDKMALADTDRQSVVMEEAPISTNSFSIEQSYLPAGEYKAGPTNKEYVFLHHTAGWHNPYKVIADWGRDSRGTIATEFVIGGPSIKGNDSRFDGEVVQAFPAGGYGWHLGRNGSSHMHRHSVGVEICNFGWLKDGKTWAGTTAHTDQVVTLSQAFRGYKTWHRYSDKQIDSLKHWILWVANRDSIDIKEGLVAEIHRVGAFQAFEYNDDAFYGRVKGMWTHTNTRKDKTDLFPQQELVDMLVSL